MNNGIKARKNKQQRIVPVFFIFFEYLQEKIRPVMKEEADQQFLQERMRTQKESLEKEANEKK